MSVSDRSCESANGKEPSGVILMTFLYEYLLVALEKVEYCSSFIFVGVPDIFTNVRVMIQMTSLSLSSFFRALDDAWSLPVEYA
jgi:hypothetical protein